MTFEEYKDTLRSRPPREHEALWKTYSYGQVQRLTLDLVRLRTEAAKYGPKEHQTNVVDFESYRKRLADDRAVSGGAGSHR